MKGSIGVLGAGAWGQALAFVAAKAGHEVIIWSRSTANDVRLDHVKALIIAVPAQAVRQVLGQIAVPQQTPLLISAKGIERQSSLFMHELVAEVLPGHPIFVLSGPSFASDVLRGQPTAVTLAGPTLQQASLWASALSLKTFRIYASDDVKGVELGGALKNVLAIACGIADGRALGASARAALTTRGFAELQRLGRAMGAKAETLMGLSGLGDLLLTCSTPQSRNYAFGLAVGRGASVVEALRDAKGVVEGAASAAVARSLAQRYAVELPIISAVAAIIEDGASPDVEIARLLARPQTVE